MPNERLGKVHFWMMMLGFNATFVPMHILGLKGMPREYYTYQEGFAWEMWNSAGDPGGIQDRRLHAGVHDELGEEQAARTDRLERPAGRPDPGVDDSLSPTRVQLPPGPLVTSVDERLEPQAQGGQEGPPGPVPAGGAEVEPAVATAPKIHMPSPSIYPLVAALGMPVMGYAVILNPGWGSGSEL